jgi:hypothetical protein
MDNGKATEPDRDQPRDARGRYLSGKRNPKAGRRPGSKNRPKPEVLAQQKAKKELAALLGEAVEVLRAGLAAEDEGTRQQAAKTIMAKVLPDGRSAGSTVEIPELADPHLSLEQKAQVLSRYLGQGKITVEQHQQLSRALESQARIADVEAVQQVLTLVKQGTSVSDAIAEVERRGARVTH